MSAVSCTRKRKPSFRILLPAALLLAAGCSSAVLYDRIDWFARMYVQRYVDLDAAQTDWLAQNLEEWTAWHRVEELPRYETFLAGLEQDLGKEITNDTVATWVGELRILYDRILEQSTPPLVNLAERLSKEQIARFLQKLERRGRKEEQRYLSRDERRYRKDIRDQIGDRIEYWLGSLTPAQVQEIESVTAHYNRLDEEWLKANDEWRRQLAEVLLNREPGWRERLAELIRTRDAYLEDSGNASRVENERLVYRTVVEVLNSRTEKQDRNLKERLRKWREQIALMRSVSSAPDS